MAVRLEWEGKPQQVERLSLPFQTVETINESRATRERDAGSLLQTEARSETARNQLIWGDNKLVMSSLLRDFAGQVKLVYIDPPFDDGRRLLMSRCGSAMSRCSSSHRSLRNTPTAILGAGGGTRTSA